MAGLFNETFRQSFTAQSVIVVTHNLDRVNLHSRLLIGGIVRQDLVLSTNPTPSNPTNEFTMVLSSSQTGVVQVLEVDSLLVIDQSHPVTINTVDPTVTDDSSAGFSVGDHWVNTANLRIYQVIDVSVGTAIWERVDNQGEGAGPGAAVNPGELMFGTLLDYPAAGNSSSGEIQYVRLKLSQGLVLSDTRTFIDSGGSGSRNIRMGLYSQTTPGDSAGDPVTRVAQTNAVSTAGANGTFITEAFIGGDFTIPTTGFYWLALITDSPSLKFAVSATHRADFLSTRHEAGTGTTLPATSGSITNPVSAVIYVAGIEA